MNGVQVIVGLALSVLLAACAGPDPNSRGPETPTATSPSIIPTPAATPAPTPTASPPPLPLFCNPCSVGIRELAFHPPTRRVFVGTEVVWTNIDPTTHTVTFDNGEIDSLELAPGASFRHTFVTTGTFTYRCVIHADMLGSVIVLP